MKRILALAVALAACSGGSKDRTQLESPKVVRGPATESEPGQIEYASAPECVVATPGVAITTREVSGGIALSLVGEPAREGQVRELGRSIVSTVQHDRRPAELEQPPSPAGPGELDEPPTPDRTGGLDEPLSTPLPGEQPSTDVADVATSADSDGTVDPAAMRGYEIDGDQHIAVDAATEDVSGGVEVIITAKLAGDIDPLREVVRAFAERLRSGDCPERISATGL